jgi:hypothetical protein
MLSPPKHKVKKKIQPKIREQTFCRKPYPFDEIPLLAYRIPRAIDHQIALDAFELIVTGEPIA